MSARRLLLVSALLGLFLAATRPAFAACACTGGKIVYDAKNSAINMAIQDEALRQILENEVIRGKLSKEAIVDLLVKDKYLGTFTNLASALPIGDIKNLFSTRIADLTKLFDLLGESSVADRASIRSAMRRFDKSIAPTEDVQSRMNKTSPERVAVDGNYVNAVQRMETELSTLVFEAAEKVSGGKEEVRKAFHSAAASSPLSLPEYRDGVTRSVIDRDDLSSLEKSKLLLVASQNGRLPLIAEIGARLAVYEDSDSEKAAFREPFEEIVKESKRTAEKAADLPKGDGCAIKTNAGLAAANAELIAMQNLALLQFAKIFRDEARVAATMAILALESSGQSRGIGFDQYRRVDDVGFGTLGNQ
jgi:hypothetical protein